MRLREPLLAQRDAAAAVAGAVDAAPAPVERARWRSVAVPSEHGGWGLTLEPVLLGSLLTPSWAGVLIGVAAFAAFLARTPAKLVAVDVRRDRWLPRTSLAARIAAVEVAVIAAAATGATVLAGPSWWWAVALAAPLIIIEASFEVRSHGRRLAPEVCGAVGVAATASAIVLAGGGGTHLAAAAWIVLGARSVGAIPFVRAQIVRSRRGIVDVRTSDVAQIAALALGWTASVVDHRALAGSIVLTAIVAAQARWSRREPPPIKVIGMRQMLLGFALVAVTALAPLPL
jgi:hypothetical protein